MNEVQQLLQQVRILEQEAANKTGAERQALQKAAAKVKMQIIKLLPQRGQQQQQQGSKIPDPSEYFGAKLPEGFENYFSGDYLTPEMESYFDNLTPEMESYFATPKIAHFDNAPDAPKQQQPAKAKDDEEAELRRRIFAALGIFY
ncbi:TPA: hypothetical protein OT838_004390 [Escherichia coli]|nr:hypothetical protein [Escherichia coli]